MHNCKNASYTKREKIKNKTINQTRDIRATTFKAFIIFTVLWIIFTNTSIFHWTVANINPFLLSLLIILTVVPTFFAIELGVRKMTNMIDKQRLQKMNEKNAITEKEAKEFLEKRGFMYAYSLGGRVYPESSPVTVPHFSGRTVDGHYCLVEVGEFKAFGRTRDELLSIVPEKYHGHVCK